MIGVNLKFTTADGVTINPSTKKYVYIIKDDMCECHPLNGLVRESSHSDTVKAIAGERLYSSWDIYANEEEAVLAAIESLNRKIKASIETTNRLAEKLKLLESYRAK